MITLKSLTFQNIGRFTEQQVIDFNRLGGLVQVDGQNNNTGGSSGSGKSTIFKALEFLFGLNDISNTVLQSRLTKDAMVVIGLFELDGIPFKIERGKKLLIDFNGEVITGSSKLTEERLDQIIGMPRDLFRKILVKRQGEGGFFLNLLPSETHKFLTNCLGLQNEQSKILKLDERLSALSASAALTESAVNQNKMGLDATESAILSLGAAPVLETNAGAIEELIAKHLEAQSNHNLVKLTHKQEKEALDLSRPVIKSTPFDRSKIEQLELEIGMIASEIAKLEKAENSRQLDIKDNISALQAISNKAANAELARQNEVKNQIYTLQLEIGKIQSAEQARQAQVKSKISALQMELIKSKATISLGATAKEEAILLAQELKKVQSAVCPTCEQGWITDACKAKEAAIFAKLSTHKAAVIAGMEASNRVTLVDQQIQALKLDAEPRVTLDSDLNQKIAQLRLDAEPRVVPEVLEISYQIEHLKVEAQPKLIGEAIELSKLKILKDQLLGTERKAEQEHQFALNRETQAILVNWESKRTELAKSHEDVISYVRNAENEALASLEAAKHKMKSFLDNLQRFETSLGKLNDQATKYRVELSNKILQLTSIQEEIELATESKKAIKSYLSASFEDALDSIGDQATRLIRAIPNMANATIQFEGLKETKEGKIKEEVVCSISMDGEISIPIKSLSGGERSSTDLAIDLSVIKFIEERTGKGISLFVLDEPFTGLDTTNVFEALEMLKECSSDKQLLIVDHNPVAAQSIESRLTVVRDGLTSRIVQ